VYIRLFQYVRGTQIASGIASSPRQSLADAGAGRLPRGDSASAWHVKVTEHYMA